MNIPELFDTLVNYAEQYGFWIILLLAILHPLTENPWSFLTMSIGLRILGIPLGYGTIFLGNIIGIILLYLIFHGIHQKTNYIAQQKKISKKVLEWVEQAETWRHIVVIGMPMIPTYPVKIALPLSNMSFRKYFLTLLGSYAFLYSAYSLLYFGLIGFITDAIPNSVAIICLAGFALYIYFGKSLRQKWRRQYSEGE